MSLLDHQLLRTLHPRHCGPYLHKVVTEGKTSTDAISRELLHAVANQSLPPQAYELWLCACPDETAIVLGLQQPQSVLVRRGAIKAFKQWFRTSKCVDIWLAVGGTEGIVDMFTDFSVNHVQEFCKVLGQCNTSEALRDERQKLVTELMYSLASRIFPTSAKVQNPDERPLWKSYAELVYACTPKARDAWIDEKRLPELNMEKVMETDTDYYQAQCLLKATAGDKDLQRYSALFVSLPPRMSPEDPTVSESMEFAAHFLETLDEHNVELVKGGGERKLGTAFVTIIRRLARRNVSEDFVLEAISLLSKCAKQHVVEEASGYSSNYGHYLTDIARLWARNSDAFEGPLSGLLKISERINYPSLVAAISVVPMKGRYRLLRWIVLTQHEIDLEDPDQLPRLRYPVPWALPIALPKSEARALVERVVSVKGEKDAWFDGTMPDVRIPTGEGVTVVLDLLRCHLLDDNNIRLSEASMKTAQYQRLAEKERDAQSRVKWVVAAGHVAVASGSLEVLKDVLIWARRFNRDPLITQFYAPDAVLRKIESLSLLSGIPERLTSATQQDVIENNVCKGNEIVLLLLETAAMCQNEPTFYATHWSGVQHLFAEIVQIRIQRVRRVQSRLGLSDEEVKKSIWEPTLDALIDAERLGLDETNQALQFNEKNGPLDIWGDVNANNPNSSVLWFIDELAIRRDTLWQHHRCSVHTNVMTLEAPFPRGLPVQDLLSVYIQGKVSGEGLPFVTKRAHNVVFMSQKDASRAIPIDKEDRAAIGCFVDDYSVALKLYVSGCNTEEKRKRSHSAWKHATTQLSNSRLSAREAIMYWRDVFSAADISFPASNLELRPAPRVPQVEIDDDPEWNPDMGPHPTIKERNLDPTCVDCFTFGTRNKTIHDAFTVPQPSISYDNVPGFWDFDRPGSDIPSAAKDGFIAAGLLLIDALSQANAKILSEKFPQDNARFPAVFLDSDFVESQRSFNAFPLELLNSTPPVLLEQLTAALIAKLCASTNPPPALVKWTFTTLKLLAWSDDPGLAIRHIVHVIVNLPEHSSWHRVMLHPGVLKRLSTKQSKDLVASLAEAINEKSRQRKLADAAKSSSSAEAGNDTKLNSATFVKVTTVKLLAQLMGHAEFIGGSFSVEILMKLFMEATHVDIRAAVVQSLLEVVVVESTKSDPIKETVMSMLETHVVPFAAELSERSPMTEQRWTECEEKCEPPEIDKEGPAHGELTTFVHRSSYLRDPSATRELVRRLLLPLIQRSAANAQRWLKIVLRASNASELYAHVPTAFGSYNMLRQLLEKHTQHMPAALFDDLHAMLVFSAKDAKQHQDLRDCLETRIPIRSRGVFLRLSTFNASRVFEPDTADLLKAAVFATSEDAIAYGLLTPTQIQAHERTMVDIRLARFDEHPVTWNFLADRYDPPLRQKEATQAAWYAYCRPLVEYMVKRIGATRTIAWLQDAQRQPARLPEAFLLRLWLLTYPSRPWRADNEQELRRDKFVKELRDVVEQLAQSGRPYHKHFDLVVTAAKRCYEKDWAFIAWRLGRLEEAQTGRDFTLAVLLRVELADVLLQGAKQPVSEGVMSGVKDMLAQWRRCLDEDVRDRGITTTALLKKNATNKDALPFE